MSLLLATLSGGGGPTIVEADFNASGSATAAAVGCSVIGADASASGQATTSFVGCAVFAGVAASSGASTVAFVGCAIALSQFGADGTCTVLGVGEDAGSTPVVPTPVAEAISGGIAIGFGDSYYRVNTWSEEQDEDELLEIAHAFLLCK